MEEDSACISVDHVNFCCQICLELMQDPVTIPCGHSFCMTCITTCWDQGVDDGDCRCPYCRQMFTPRPVLGRNTILADMVGKLKRSELPKTAESEECSPGPGEVVCGSCVGSKRKAEKSCLVCLDSYCQAHFEQHEELNPGKRHKVVDALNIEEKTCGKHGKLLEAFCRTDQECVCLTCVTDNHKGHDIISTEAGKNEKKVQLKASFQQQIQKRESELQVLRGVVEPLKSSAQIAVAESEELFAKLVEYVKQTCSITQRIRDQEQAETARVLDLTEQVVEELADLRRRDTELDQLPNTEDHIDLLQSLLSLADRQSAPTVSISHNPSFGSLKYSVELLKKNVIDCCEQQMNEICREVDGVFLEAKTRDGMLMYHKELTLNTFTAFRHHELLEEYTKVKWSNVCISRGDRWGDRFSQCRQVLCNESLSSRAYWEVEWSGGGGIAVAVAYDTMDRKGSISESGFGNNEESWALRCYNSSFGFKHAGNETIIPGPSCDCIGVYLDYEAGLLAFYGISNKTSTFLHKVHTTFSKPLYPGFYVDSWSELKLRKPQVRGRRY
ncbi:tripartite motif-containing protein 16-like [Brachyhypopomus gauderio]|uniref:tripartite motif-containing protein 16-like n=1 Tax=Brachyhypopomus gauderio TaxID=698409 RepID=UPI0040437765